MAVETLFFLIKKNQKGYFFHPLNGTAIKKRTFVLFLRLP